MPRPLALLPVLLVAPLAGCITYGVGMTAETVAPGEVRPRVTLQAGPGADPAADSGAGTGGGLPQLFAEARLGLDDRTDLGVRYNGLMDATATVKRRLTPDSLALGVAAMGGVGLVNAAEHVAVEATLVVSGPPGLVTPYGGARVVQTFPVAAGALHDRPTVGAFGGVRLGRAEGGASVEVGVFYDPSALGVRRRDVIVVPSLTLDGRLAALFLQRLFGGP